MCFQRFDYALCATASLVTLPGQQYISSSRVGPGIYAKEMPLEVNWRDFKEVTPLVISSGLTILRGAWLGLRQHHATPLSGSPSSRSTSVL